MDTSETYIKMCQKATETQAKAPLFNSEGDDCEFWFPGIRPFDKTIKRIWLPRQDQLQGMFGDYDTCLSHLHNFQCPEGDAYQLKWYERCTSMEQLWLNFVMKAKYGKLWNGVEWVKP